MVTVFERSLKELNALEKSPGPFSDGSPGINTPVLVEFFFEQLSVRSQQDHEEDREKSYKTNCFNLNQSVLAVLYLSSSITNCVKQNSNFE